MNREPEQTKGSVWRQDGPESDTLRLLAQPRPGLETRLLARLSAEGKTQADRHWWRLGSYGWMRQRMVLGTGFALMGTALLAVLVMVRLGEPVAGREIARPGAALRGAGGQAGTGTAMPATGARDAGSFGTAGSMRVPTTPPTVKPLHVPPPPRRRPGRRGVVPKKTDATKPAAKAKPVAVTTPATGTADSSGKTQ